MLDIVRQWSTSSRRLGALFLLVLVPSAAILVWLGAQLIEQDRQLWTRRDDEQREAAAEIIVRALSAKLTATSTALESGVPPDGTVVVTLNAAGLTVRPRERVLWMPVVPDRPEANADLFADAEITEFRRTADRGLAVYQKFQRASDPAVRAGALVRLARVQRTAGDVGAAIQTYRDLARLTGIAINGMPADLVARRAVCELLAGTHDTVSLAQEAASLRDDFLAGHWMLDGTEWTLAAGDIEQWTSRPLEVSEGRTLSSAIDWLWHQYQDSRSGDEHVVPKAGRQVLRTGDASVLVQWQPDDDGGLTAVLVPPAVVTRWMHDADPTGLTSADALVLTDPAGVIVAGTRAESGTRPVTRLAADTGLPWNVALKPGASATDKAALTSRQTLLWAGLGVIMILLSGGGYILWRTVQREMAVARIQTDFVAAVSHEFRTPLTSLQHATELLDEDDHLPGEDKQALYSALRRNTHRLHGLVESLLDFARMEDGRKPYDLQPIDPSLLVRDIVSEFERHTTPGQTVITQDMAPAGTLGCRGDAAALRHAIWNLLENAVKYSPAPHRVHVSVGLQGRDVSIGVADRGFGIPAHEQRTIFHKFVRGSDTVRRGIKGTGLGLAMVTHIVTAHRGRIDLESEEGRGSTFTLVLPADSMKDATASEHQVEADKPRPGTAS